VQFFTDFFTKEVKNSAIQGNVVQRKSLKNMPRAEEVFDPESGVLPIGRSPSRWEEKNEPQQVPEDRGRHDSSYLI
jgi:hypothetical protein